MSLLPLVRSRTLWLTASFALFDCSVVRAADASFLHAERWPEFLAIIILVLSLAVAGRYVRKHGPPRFRPLPPMEAIDDAVGRSTELGAPVVYTTGWGGDMARPTTMASMVILSAVARRCAEHNCRLLFPSHDPIIVTVAQETVSHAATVAGRPEWFVPDDIAFVTQSQFGYASAFSGLVARHKPGGVLLLGTFEGEALLLAEAAHEAGAVTIAGTDSTIQLSFFLVACDYTLIGEELFAAAGIASGDDRATASILAQDALKYLLITMIILGSGFLLLGFRW